MMSRGSLASLPSGGSLGNAIWIGQASHRPWEVLERPRMSRGSPASFPSGGSLGYVISVGQASHRPFEVLECSRTSRESLASLPSGGLLGYTVYVGHTRHWSCQYHPPFHRHGYLVPYAAVPSSDASAPRRTVPLACLLVSSAAFPSPRRAVLCFYCILTLQRFTGGCSGVWLRSKGWAGIPRSPNL